MTNFFSAAEPKGTARVEVAASPTTAHLYEIFDRSEQIAALVVALDPQQRMLYAELLYYDRDRSLESLQSDIYKRARKVVQSNYLGSNGMASELRVLEANVINTEQVEHHNPEPTFSPRRLYRLWHLAAGYGALLGLLLLIGVINRMGGPAVPSPAETTVAVAPAAAPAAAQAAAPAADPAADPEADPDGIPAAALSPQTDGLAVSIHADNRLKVSMRVRSNPNYSTEILTQPDPERGEPVGTLGYGAEATLLGGPTWLAGESDTIVWWYVETEDGIRGWTPANSSEYTLLTPVE
ncbi:MAG: hypothetical protein ACKO4U_16205 [Caldilinea sp.]